MIRHSNSFIFSIFIHIGLFLLLYLSYKEVTTGIKVEKKEQLLCVKLNTLCRPKSTVTPPSPLKTIQKKKENKPIQQKKKFVQKRVKKKAEPIKKILKATKQPVEEKVVKEKESIIKKIVKEPAKKLQKSTKPEIVKNTQVKPVQTSKPKVAPEKEYIDENIEKIIALLQENLYYPRRARKRGIEGEVIVRFRLSTDAKVSNIAVLSSNSEILSRGALQTIENIDKKLPKPKQDITFNIPISYKLN